MIGEEIVAKWVPLAWEAFLDYRRNAVHLSRIEAQVLGAVVANAPERAQTIAESAGLLTFDESGKAHASRADRARFQAAYFRTYSSLEVIPFDMGKVGPGAPPFRLPLAKGGKTSAAPGGAHDSFERRPRFRAQKGRFMLGYPVSSAERDCRGGGPTSAQTRL